MVDVIKSPVRVGNVNDKVNSNQKYPDNSNQSKKNNKPYFKPKNGGNPQKEKYQNKFEHDKNKRNTHFIKNERNVNSQEKSKDVSHNDKPPSNRKDNRYGNKSYRRNNENGHRFRDNNNYRNKGKPKNAPNEVIKNNTTEETIQTEGEQKNNPSVWNANRDWTKHFVQNTQTKPTENVAKDEKKTEKTPNTESISKEKTTKNEKETVKDEKKNVVEETKPSNSSETEKAVNELENLKIDSENNIPSNDNKPQNKPKVFLPSIDLNNDYDQQLKVTFGGKINTTKTGNEEPYQEHLPIDPNHMANFQPPNESNQFVIPTNNMIRYPYIPPPMYSQPIYHNEFPNEMGWDGYPYSTRIPRNNGKKGFRNNKSQPKRGSKFPSHFRQMGDQNDKNNNISDNINNTPDLQNINQNKNFDTDPSKSENMNDHYAMYRPPEQFAPFYGNNLFSVHNGMMMPPFYNQYPPQMYYYPPHYDNNFENNQFPPTN